MTIQEPTTSPTVDDLAVDDGAAAEDTANDETKEPTAELTEEEAAAEAAAKKCTCIKRIIIGAILLGLIIFVIVDSQTNNWVRTGIVTFLEWVENNVVAGVFGFMALYFFATIFWVPGSILTLGAGFVFSAALNSLGWGVLLGTVAVWVGASLGAIASFLLGRYLFRDGFVGKLTQKFTIFKALDNAFKENGLRIMVLLRLSPIIPFNALNYIAGVTGVQLWHYVVACVAMLPGTVLYIFLGASAGSLTAISGAMEDDEDAEENPSNNRAVTISVVVVGVVFGIAAIAVTSYYAKQELNKVLEAEKAQAGEEGDAEDGEGGDNEPKDGDEEEQAVAIAVADADAKSEENSM